MTIPRKRSRAKLLLELNAEALKPNADKDKLDRLRRLCGFIPEKELDVTKKLQERGLVPSWEAERLLAGEDGE